MKRDGPPVGYTVEHASHDFAAFAHRTRLTPEQQLRFSDYGTMETVPQNGRFIITGPISRALVDLNRHPHHEELFPTHDFTKPDFNQIWKPGMELRESEKDMLYRRYYLSHHNQILRQIRRFGREALLVAWHNTDDRANYTIGENDAGELQEMKPIILSNYGAENSAMPHQKRGSTTSHPALLENLVTNLTRALKKYGLPDEVFLNLGYRGGYTVQRYNTFRSNDLGVEHTLHAVQVEYGTSLTHDNRDPHQPNLEKMRRLTGAFTEAINETCKNF